MRAIDGRRITTLREQRGWTQAQLAEAAGVTPSVISRLERNLQADFKLGVVVAVADALGVSLDALLGRQVEIEAAGTLVVDLRSVLADLSTYPPAVQQHVAEIMRAYLDGLPARWGE